MALDGSLIGHTIAGETQIRNSTSTSSLPPAATLNIRFEAQRFLNSRIFTDYPTPPSVIFEDDAEQTAAADFSVDANGNPAPLSAERTSTVYLSPEKLASSGFGNLSVSNPEGDITVPAGTELNLGAGSSITLTSSNITVAGNIIAAGGALSFNVHNISPYLAALEDAAGTGQNLPPDPALGNFTLRDGATLSTAGVRIDDRFASGTEPALTTGGVINIRSWSADLAEGSTIDVSGGFLVAPNGRVNYGNGGSLGIQTGRDIVQTGVLGGSLNLGSTLQGYSGTKGASLSIQSQSIQIGGTAPAGNILHLTPEFFNEGGFNTFTLTGLLSQGENPALLVAENTLIEPVIKKLEVLTGDSENPALSVNIVDEPIAAFRQAASINLVGQSPEGAVIAAGAVIRTEPRGSISVTGQTVTVLGSLMAPGGSITVGGSSSTASVFGPSSQPLVTTHIGADAVISTAGTTLLLPDPFGRRIGTVLNGGTVTLSGNIAALAGSVVDVSGTTSILDLDPFTNPLVPLPRTSAQGNGFFTTNNVPVVPTTVDSNGGNINLRGGEFLASDATLIANAGGSTALGGNLNVSSGIFNPFGSSTPADINLTVTQSGPTINGGSGNIGTALASGGRFAADTFTSGGFDSLSLNGVVSFSGPVSLHARGELALASTGFLYANSQVDLSAGHVSLGRPLQTPSLPEDASRNPFDPLTFSPTTGTGNITISSPLIDVGTLSLRQIGNLTLAAENGDIRGSGSLHIAGNLTLRAGQIYPTTASTLSFVAYNHSGNPGTIRVEAAGTRQLPWSAGGTLNLHASVIEQNGTLRAPFGVINLGWDGTGTAPIDLLTGAAKPVTNSLTLGSSSTTSVSGVDPTTGKALILPYGYSPDGEKWIDPRGVDITTTGSPAKAINLSAASIVTEAGSSIDLRGGGDLYAYRFVPGLGGISDILASNGSYAVVPGYEAEHAPILDYNPSTSSGNLISGQNGYSNSALKIGDRIYLDGSSSLPAGYYTLLPARYALLPGAVLVTPVANAGIGTVEIADGSSQVSGYRYNSLNTERTIPTLLSRFEVADASVFRQRALYEDYLANTFFPLRADILNIVVPPLPKDSAQLVFQASQSLSIDGSVSSSSISGGLGALIDISTPLDINIGGNTAPGTITLDAGILSSFDARSLLIGGRRVATDGGYTVQVSTNNITVDNSGEPLTARDLILASRSHINVATGSVISSSSAPVATAADTLFLTGNGSLLRVSSSASSPVVRTDSTTASPATLSIAAEASISGNSVVLDSSSLVNLSPAASVSANSYTFGSGRISLLLQNPGTLLADPGLVLTNEALLAFQEASELNLVSYSTIDLYGNGATGDTSLDNLTLSTGEIRGINQGTARLIASNLTLSNTPSASATALSSPLSGSLSLDAETITLGANTATIGSYADVTLLASRAIIGDSTGGLATRGNLNLNAPVITGNAGSIRTISAGGHLSVTGSGTIPSTLTPGLGSSLNLTAASIAANGAIVLPSGSIQLNATSGDVTIGGLLDVSGTRTVFDQTVRYTGGGNITLSSTTGSVTVGSSAILDLTADPGGASAGNLIVSTPQGSFSSSGTILAKGGNGGNNGSFSLDTALLADFSSLATLLSGAHLTDTQAIRVRNGDVLINGTATARDFRLTADSGAITVTGTIDASGTTGGNILLSANRDLIVANGATLTVRGQDFSNAGKGGQITLEAGSQRNGIVGDGTLDLRTGSIIDLSVASAISGNATTPGTSAYDGNFTGKVHLRAPQTSGNTDVRIAALGSQIIGASSILAEGYRLYDLTSTGGAITGTLQSQILTHGQNFLGTAGSANANHTAIFNRLSSGNSSLSSQLVITPGVEIINRTGDITLGTTSTTTTASDWDLSTFRFGPNSAPGVLTLRAAGDLVFHNSISDGFAPQGTNAEQRLWLARLSAQNTNLPINAQSWSYRFTAGSDLSAADFSETLILEQLAANKGSFILGKLGLTTTAGNFNSTTASLIPTYYQVIRTGSGDIDINAGRDIRFQNQLSAIYTAGTRVTNPSLESNFNVPPLTDVAGATISLGAVQQAYAATYSMAGGNLILNAGRNIDRVALNLAGQVVPDSLLQLPTNWLSRRGHVDPATGLFSASRFTNSLNSTTWWIDFSNFFQGTGTLGGGNIALTAGNNIANVDAVAATNARMPHGTPSSASLVELGGGDLTVRAGNNIDAGVYYVERGNGTLRADNSIVTNATRSVISQASINQGLTSDYTNLPTTLFLGKGSFDISANGDILLGPVANPFLLPLGLGNSYWHKTYFSTYDTENEINVTSLGGDVTIRTSSTQPLGSNGGTAESLLRSWFTNKLVLSTTSASLSRPWLRLSETSVDSFLTAFTLSPSTLRATALSGDINLVGNLTLSPSPTGTAEIIASGSVNALQPNGFVTIGGVRTTIWGTSTINISDANPASIPGIANPLGRPNLNVSASEAAQGPGSLFDSLGLLFRESGATLGLVLESKQALHAPGLLHLDDTSPTLIYAGSGDISGLTLFSPKSTRIFAGRDISDIAFYIQNLKPTDTSVVASGRDILAYNANSQLRVEANLSRNTTNLDAGPLAGDIQISGPGTLQVLAGANIDLGTGGNNPDGTGAGIVSIGNLRNPYLTSQGADLLIGSGISTPSSLTTSNLRLTDFIDTFVNTEQGAAYLKEIDPDLDFSSLTPEQQSLAAIEVFYLILRDAGRDFPTTGNYDLAYSAIDTLFGPLAENETRPPGDIFTRSRDIRTANGGDINILAPGGGITLANTSLGNTLSPPGIITASGGNISVFSESDISIGIGRIFTLRGGDEVIWSTNGNIAAGSSSKTVLSAPPTRVIIDLQSAAVQTYLAGLATGGGIGVLATVAGVTPGNVDLIAPNGFVDAGDAGIRAAGNLNISANQVINAGNISTGGTSTGTPSISAGVSVGGITTAGNTAATTTQNLPQTTPEPAPAPAIETDDTLSLITVEVIGYGGGDPENDEDEEEKKRRRQQLEEQQDPQ